MSRLTIFNRFRDLKMISSKIINRTAVYYQYHTTEKLIRDIKINEWDNAFVKHKSGEKIIM